MTLCSLGYCWVLTFLLLQMWDIGCEAQGYTINVSPEVTAQVGLCAYIPCTFTKPSDVRIDRCLWFRNDAGGPIVASSKNPSSQIFFTGNVSTGDCSLIINDVVRSDDAPYQFRMEADISSNSYSYATKPKVTVTDLTDKPEISVGTLVAGEKSTATCRSPGVCAGTAPRFTWTGPDGKSSSYNNSYSNHTRIYFSDFTFTPSRIDNGITLTCKVAFLSATTEQTIKLDVKYPPDVNITIRGDARDTFIVKEGDSAQINCTVDGNPTAEITWIVRNEKKEAIHGQWLLYNLTNISPSNAGKYLCTGKNNIGSSERSINIIVYYAPRTPNIMCEKSEGCSIGDEHMVSIMEDTTSTLVCTAKSLPEASLSWIPSGPNTKYSADNGHLTFNKVALSDGGQFTCVANNSYGTSNSSIIIKVTAQPRNNTDVIAAVSCVVVIVLLLIGGFLVFHYFRKKKLSKKSEDKKEEMKADDSSVIYANSEAHIYGTQTIENGTNSVYSDPEDNNSSVHMNADDIHYATIDFSKLKPTNAAKNIAIVYAEIKK